jgi:hypothetical protein
VAEFFRSLGRYATTNHTVQGVRTTPAINVYVKSHHVGFDVVWIVECNQLLSTCMAPGGLGLGNAFRSAHFSNGRPTGSRKEGRFGQLSATAVYVRTARFS